MQTHDRGDQEEEEEDIEDPPTWVERKWKDGPQNDATLLRVARAPRDAPRRASHVSALTDYGCKV